MKKQKRDFTITEGTDEFGLPVYYCDYLTFDTKEEAEAYVACQKEETN